MIDAYLLIEGIPGESTADGFADHIELLAFGHSVHQSTDISASSTGGATTGRCTHADFSCTKLIDIASPLLAQSCSAGTHIPKATISLVRSGGEEKVPFMVYTLSEIIVSDVAYSGDREELPSETISFNYAIIEWVYTQQKRKGGGGAGNTTGSWNLATNSKV